MKTNNSSCLSRVSILVLTFAITFATPSLAQQSDYELVDLDSLVIQDMNDSGVLTGTQIMTPMNVYTQPAYVWENGNLTYLTPDGFSRSGKAINNMGLVLVQTSESIYRCFDSMGAYTYEAFPGLNGVKKALGVDINDRGLMVGYTGQYTGSVNDDPNHMPKPFTWMGNQVTPFLGGGFDWMDVAAVNNKDQIVGVAGVKMQLKGRTTQIMYNRYGYVFSNQVITNLGKDVFPRAINYNGVVVGSYVPASKGQKTQVPNRAFIYENGVKTEIPGFTALAAGVSSNSLVWSYANDVNDAKQVVGGFSFISTDGSSVQKAFYWDSSSGVIDLNSLLPADSGWVLESAQWINNQGAIVGHGKYNGEQHRFLLKPMP